MFTVAVLRPSKPRSYASFEVLGADGRDTFLEFGHLTTEVALDAFAHQSLVAIELIPNVVQPSTALVEAVVGHGEYLIVRLYLQLQFLFNVRSYVLRKSVVQAFFAIRQKDDVIGILCAIQVQHFIDLMHEIAQGKVGKELRQIVAYGQSIRTVDYLVNQPNQIIVLYLPSDKAFQHMVLQRWVKLADVNLQAIERSALIAFNQLINTSCAALNSAAFDAGIGVVRESFDPNRL